MLKPYHPENTPVKTHDLSSSSGLGADPISYHVKNRFYISNKKTFSVKEKSKKAGKGFRTF